MSAEREARLAEVKGEKKVKNKMKGRSRVRCRGESASLVKCSHSIAILTQASRRAAKKESNIWDEKRAKRMEQLEAAHSRKKKDKTSSQSVGALSRFATPVSVHF